MAIQLDTDRFNRKIIALDSDDLSDVILTWVLKHESGGVAGLKRSLPELQKELRDYARFASQEIGTPVRTGNISLKTLARSIAESTSDFEADGPITTYFQELAEK